MQRVAPSGRAGTAEAVKALIGTKLVFIERCACIGLAALLVASGAFALYSAGTTRSALAAVAVANALNDRYQEARYAVGAEESLERKYRLEPSAEVRADHHHAEMTLAQAIRDAQTVSTPDDAKRNAAVLRVHEKYVRATAAMFAAVDAGRPDRALVLDHNAIDPVFDFVQRNVFSRAEQQRVNTNNILSHLHALQRLLIATSVVLAVLTLGCFLAYTAVLDVYKRRLGQAHRQELDQLSRAALTDNLTGVGNHRAYKEELERQIARAVRHGEPLALALLDIDEMKLLNDQNGHVFGDRVLVALGSLLAGLRAEDRAFRLGGDEFGVLLPLATAQSAHVLMERLRRSAQTSLSGATLSIGIAAFGGPSGDGEALHAQADAALYAAKRAGRNACAIFDADADEMWLLSPRRVRQLRDLIAEGAVSIAFQPIWDIAKCTILAYEALARPAPGYGFAGPQDAFDLAERVGRAHEIDAVCLRAALARAQDLPPDALLFLNVTPQSLDHGHLNVPDFVAQVRAAGLTPERIVIEITERSIANLNAIVNVARQLQAAGFGLALDDTGAGNAGLEMLSRLAVEYVKIDRAIIVQALTDRTARGVMAGIIAIARATGAYVIAEGIEDTAMLDLACGQAFEPIVQQRSVRGVQGYLLQRPAEKIVAVADAGESSEILREAAARQRTSGTKPFALDEQGVFAGHR